ncbi:MAG: hypothetical protein FWD31_15665 [Planctomycetaceae bacterium]|nr:hypothetical protein [Planctomycetaceae bacterium]
MSRLGRLRSGRQSGNPVTLFPVLSVLICTMGTLILLLVAINRNVRTQAAERSGINTAEIIAELDIEAQTLAVFANDLQKSKELTIADIETERARLATLEKIIETMVLEIQQAEAALQALRNNNTVRSETGQLAETLAAKQKALRLAELELQELRENAAHRKSSYAIIPYRGQNATDRRPVYIECRSDSVVIHPEGIVMREDDFITASHPDNPLDALLRAASLYYTENELVSHGTKPYPLIIVRPSGIDAYYAVRESIQSWGEHFGYELVEEDWKLEFPPPNEALKQRLEMQLAASRERMIPYKMMLMQQYAAAHRLSGDMLGGRHSGLPGGNTPAGGMPASGIPAGGMPGQGDGFENVDWRHVMSSVGGGGPSGQAQKPNIEYRVAPGGNMVRYVDGAPSEARVATGNDSRANAPRQTGTTAQRGVPGAYPATVFPQYAANATTELSVMQPGQLYSETLYPATSSNGGTPRDVGIDGEATSGQSYTTTNPITPNPQQGELPLNLFARQPTETATNAATPDVPQTAGSFSGYGMSSPRPPAMNENMASPENAMPPLGTTRGDASQIPPNAPLPAPRWTMPNVGQGATEIARPIVVECRTDKILIKRAGGAGFDREIDIPPNGSVYNVADRLVSHVVDYIDTWGNAARGTYWQPEMNVTVQPGAEARFEELQSLMHNSGVRLRKK